MNKKILTALTIGLCMGFCYSPPLLAQQSKSTDLKFEMLPQSADRNYAQVELSSSVKKLDDGRYHFRIAMGNTELINQKMDVPAISATEATHLLTLLEEKIKYDMPLIITQDELKSKTLTK